jgi:hypothetical protein
MKLNKNLLYTTLVLSVALSSTLSADDAFVLPKHLFRFTINTAYTSFDDRFGQASKESAGKEIVDSFLSVNSAAELEIESTILRNDLTTEFGVTDRVSALMHIPFYSFAETNSNPNSTMKTSIALLNNAGQEAVGEAGYLFTQQLKVGEAEAVLGDILLGAKYLLFNTAGSLNSATPGTFRGAILGGVSIPTGSENSNPLSSNIGTTRSGVEEINYLLRTYWDYQIEKHVYLNLYTEHEYRPAGSTKIIDLHAGSTITYDAIDLIYDPGEYHKFELDLAIHPELSSNWASASGFKLIGEFVSEGTYSKYPSTYGDEVNDSKITVSSEIISFQPYLGLQYKGGAFPMEAKLKYTHPVKGRNANDAKVVELQYRAYLKFW